MNVKNPSIKGELVTMTMWDKTWHKAINDYMDRHAPHYGWGMRIVWCTIGRMFDMIYDQLGAQS